MAAPQQSETPIFKDSYGVPKPQVNYHRVDARDTPGAALAQLLGALPEAAKTHQNIQEEATKKSPEEVEQLAALAKIGADKTNVRIAKGDNFFGIMKSKDATMDGYELSRGQTDADLWAGGLRDRYNEAGLAENDDPQAFKKFQEQERNRMLAELKDKDPSYHHGFVTRVASAFEEMGVAHAGNLDKFVPAKRKKAAELAIEARTNLELSVKKEETAVGLFLKSIGQGEAVSYDARHGYANGDGSTKFSEMTIDEVLRWQASGAWKRTGGKSSAVGKHQFIRATLLEEVRKSGLDPKTTKFTPEVQDKLIMQRLLGTRRLGDYLSGKISAEEFVDKHLKFELASIQGLDGKGAYDGDGLNRAGIPARSAIAAAIALKEAVLRDPASLVKDADGRWVIGNQTDPQANPQARVRDTLENAETEHGISQKDAREAAANALIKFIEADPANVDRVDLVDKMADWKLSQEQRAKVEAARERIRSELNATSAIDAKKKNQQIVEGASAFIRTGDLSALDPIKSLDYETYNKLLLRQSGKTEGDYELVDRKDYLADASRFDDPDFPEVATNDYLNGGITKDTYIAALDRHKTIQAAKPVLELPGVDDYLDTVEQTLPEATRQQFRKALSTAVVDLQTKNNGERPSLNEIFDEVTNLHARFAAVTQQKVQSAKDRLTAQDQQEDNG